MAESTSLLKEANLKGSEGSNPSVSATCETSAKSSVRDEFRVAQRRQDRARSEPDHIVRRSEA